MKVYDPENMKAIKDIPCPADVNGVQRLSVLFFFFFFNYLAKFQPNIADVIASTHNLAKADVL